MKSHQLIASKGTGSMLAELAFAAAALPLDVRYVEWTDAGLVDAELVKLNPLAQTPTMILPDGSILTESAAIMMRASDLAPQSGLAPIDDQVQRTRFFHWLMLINAAIYPTFTYGDFPEKWVPGQPEASSLLKRTTDEHRCKLWQRAEADAKSPWFLGETFSALDLYIFAMTSWRPGRKWFEANTPKLVAIAKKIEGDSRFVDVIRKNRVG